MIRHRSTEGVELNLTAMLDMAFQLLAFFVLTFRSAPNEPAICMHLPPVRPASNIPKPPSPPINQENFTLAGIDTLRIDLFSATGDLDRITINGSLAEDYQDLQDKLRLMLGAADSPIEQVVVHASDNLRYDNVMKVVGICCEQKLPRTNKLPKLSLAAMGDRNAK